MSNQHNYAAIMAGGVGSRFWPGSRDARPKQFLDLLGTGKSLLRQTFERFQKVCPNENIYILTNSRYRDMILEQLPEIADEQVLCEPSRNNTAPCIAWLAFKLYKRDPQANFVVAPSDAVILKEEAFTTAILKALDFTAQRDALMTLGIQPTHPNTGYGYINYIQEGIKGIHKVIRFTEKPDAATAEQFVESGEYLWNAGIFIWKAEHILKAFSTHNPEIHSIFDAINSEMNTSDEQAKIDEYYPTCPNISIDYAIMEKANNVYTLPADIGWSDLGTWASLHVESPKDNHGNVVNTKTALLEETANTLIRVPEGKLVVVKGLDDFIVVDEGDVLLIYPKSKEQEIKAIRNRITEEYGERFS